MRKLRLMLLVAGALVLIGASAIPLLQVVAWGRLYIAAATNQMYTPLPDAGRSTHFFDGSTLRFLQPAMPYFVIFVLLQCGAAYVINVLLSGSTAFKARSFLTGLCLCAALSTAATMTLWIRTS